jgi:hypothetical protein
MDLALKIQISDERLKIKLIDNYVSLVNKTFKSNPVAYIKFLTKFCHSSQPNSFLAQNDSNSRSKLFKGLNSLESKLKSSQFLDNLQEKMGFLLYYYSKFYSQNPEAIIGQNFPEMYCGDLLRAKFVGNLGEMDFSNLIMGLGGLGYQRKLLESGAGEGNVELIRGLDESIERILGLLYSKQDEKDFEVNNWQKYSTVLRVCSELEFKDDVLMKNMLGDLEALVALENEKNRNWNFSKTYRSQY